jgi:hypothetical protein
MVVPREGAEMKMKLFWWKCEAERRLTDRVHTENSKPNLIAEEYRKEPRSAITGRPKKNRKLNFAESDSV